MKHKFHKNQNVFYMQGNALLNAKIVTYIPESNSYVISFRHGNTVKERETIPERLYRKDDLLVRTAYHVSMLESRIENLEKLLKKKR